MHQLILRHRFYRVQRERLDSEKNPDANANQSTRCRKGPKYSWRSTHSAKSDYCDNSLHVTPKSTKILPVKHITTPK